MSAIPTPALTATPAPDATELANLKHKYTTLEAQHATVQGRLSKRVETGQMNMGRGLHQIVYAFADPRVLVAGSDRRTRLLTSGEDVEPSPEEDTLYRSYMELIKRVQLLKNLLDRTRKPLRDYIETYAKGQTLRIGTAQHKSRARLSVGLTLCSALHPPRSGRSQNMNEVWTATTPDDCATRLSTPVNREKDTQSFWSLHARG